MSDFVQKLMNEVFFDEDLEVRYTDKVKDLFRSAETMVNTFGFKCEDIAAEIYEDVMARCIMRHIALRWIKFWGTETKQNTWMYDGRNEIAIMRCQEIEQMAPFKAEYRTYFCEQREHETGYEWIANTFVDLSRTMHRTLMQTFSCLVFAFITEVGKHKSTSFAKIDKAMADRHDEKWYRMPLI